MGNIIIYYIPGEFKIKCTFTNIFSPGTVRGSGKIICHGKFMFKVFVFINFFVTRVLKQLFRMF